MAAATPKHPLGELSHAEFSRADGTIIELDFTDPTRPVRLEADKWYSPTTLTQVRITKAISTMPPASAMPAARACMALGGRSYCVWSRSIQG